MHTAPQNPDQMRFVETGPDHHAEVGELDRDPVRGRRSRATLTSFRRGRHRHRDQAERIRPRTRDRTEKTLPGKTAPVAQLRSHQALASRNPGNRRTLVMGLRDDPSLHLVRPEARAVRIPRYILTRRSDAPSPASVTPWRSSSVIRFLRARRSIRSISKRQLSTRVMARRLPARCLRRSSWEMQDTYRARLRTATAAKNRVRPRPAPTSPRIF